MPHTQPTLSKKEGVAKRQLRISFGERRTIFMQKTFRKRFDAPPRDSTMATRSHRVVLDEDE
jgi:hypothetical protein